MVGSVLVISMSKGAVFLPIFSGQFNSICANHSNFQYTFKNILESHTKLVLSLFDLGNNRFVSGSDDKTIKIWNNYGKLQGELLGHTWSISCFTKKRENQLFSCSWDRTIRVWLTDKRKEILNLRIEEGNCIISLCNFREELIACGIWNGMINIWCLKKKSIIFNNVTL